MTKTRDLANLGSGFTPTGGAVTRTVDSKLKDLTSILDFGAVGNGIVNDASAFTAAQSAVAHVLVPSGTYRISTNLTITCALTVLRGATFFVDANITLTINGSFSAGLYQVFSGAGTVVFDGGDAVVEEFPEWRGQLPVVTCYGDSFTMGVSGGITYSQAYINLIAKAKNWNIPVPPDFGSPGKGTTSVGNQAFGGSQIASTEQIDRIMAHTTTDTDIQFILTGFNDMRAYGISSAGLSTYRQTLQAALAWMAIPASSTEKLYANSNNASRVQRVGSGWSANGVWFNGQGYHTNVQGDTFNFTVFGNTIYLALPRDTSTTGKCLITVDGVNYGTYDYGNSAGVIQYGKNYSMGFVRITGLTNANHGVILTKTSATSGTDYMRVDWVAGVDGLQSAQGVLGGPQVYVGNCCRMLTAEYSDPRHGAYIQGSDAVVSAYNTIIEQCVRELASDGFNVTLVDAFKNFDPNSADLDPDLVHPSAVGMQKIANAFLERMDERKIHVKDRGTLDGLQKFIARQFTSSSLGTVTEIGDTGDTTAFVGGGTETLLSHNLKTVDGAYYRIAEDKPCWAIALSDSNVSPVVRYKAAGTGVINSWDRVSNLDGSAQESWTAPTLLNSWSNFGGGWTPARYMKDSHGFVHLDGLIANGTVPGAAFTLPAGYRPTEKCGFAVVANNAFGFVSIDAAGSVEVNSGNNTFVTLTGISFRAA